MTGLDKIKERPRQDKSKIRQDQDTTRQDKIKTRLTELLNDPNYHKDDEGDEGTYRVQSC
jgi:hypothetical protein